MSETDNGQRAKAAIESGNDNFTYNFEQNEDEYLAADGVMVRWKVHRIGEPFSPFEKELKNGTELFSRYLDAQQLKAALSPSKAK